MYGGKAFPGSSHLSRRQRYVAVHIRQTDMMRAVASDALRFNTEHYIPSTYLDLAARVARWHNVSKVFVESDSGSVFEALSQDAYEVMRHTAEDGPRSVCVEVRTRFAI